jgi:hypothetical protein
LGCLDSPRFERPPRSRRPQRFVAWHLEQDRGISQGGLVYKALSSLSPRHGYRLERMAHNFAYRWKTKYFSARRFFEAIPWYFLRSSAAFVGIENLVLSLAKAEEAIDDSRTGVAPERRGGPEPSGLGSLAGTKAPQHFANVIDRLGRRRIGESPLIMVRKIMLAVAMESFDPIAQVNPR